MGRIWTNGTGLALNATNLNGLESDVSRSVKPWAPNTGYNAGQAVIDPNGNLVTANAIHTSGASFTAANWSTPYDAAVAARVNDPASQSRGALNAAYGITLLADGSADHTAQINAALTKGGGTGVRRVVNLVGNFNITKITVPSGVTLDATAATITQISGTNTNMVISGAHNPVRTVTDAALSAGSTTLTSATAAFTSADVGMPVSIAGAGTTVGTGGLKPLYTTIVSVQSATSATIALAAITAVSAATLNIYRRASDITIRGGVWNRLNNSGTNDQAHALRMLRVDRLTLSDMVWQSTGGGKYAVNVGDVTDYRIERVTAPTGVQADLVHINGPAARGRVDMVSGTPSDDLVGVTAMDYAGYSDISGPITQLDVSNLSGNPGAAVLLKLCGSKEQGAYLDQITARNLIRTTTADTNFYAVKLLSDCGTLDARHISLENVQGRIQAQNGTVLHLSVTNTRLVAPVSYALMTNTGSNISTLVLHNITNAVTGSSVGSLFRQEPDGSTRAKIGQLEVSNVDWAVNGGYLVEQNNALCDITALRASNVRHSCPSGGGGVISSNVGGATLVDVHLSNVETTNSAWLGDIATTTGFWLSNYKGVQLFRLRATGAVTMRGAGITLSSTTFTADAGSTARSITFDLPVDVSLLVKTAGDRANNTNASLSCGAGPVVCDGTNWKHLFTGATY